MQKIILLSLFVLSVSIVSAQKYITAAGIRAGSGIGLTLQQKLFGSFTAEAIAQKSLLKDETYLSVLFEQHMKLLTKGLNFYIGAGPHMMMTKVDGIDDKTGAKTSITSTGYGLSGIGGIEMRFKRMVFSLDYLPSVNFSGDNIFSSRTGVSARYILVKSKTKKTEPGWKIWKKWNLSGNKRDELDE